MVIGVFSVIASVTAVGVIEASFSTTINAIGSTSFSITRNPAVSFGPRDERLRNRRPITYAQMLELRERAKLPTSVSADKFFTQGVVIYNGLKTNPNIQIQAGDENWVINNSYEVAQGRSLTESDVQFAKPIALIGADVVKKLFPNESALGKEIKADGKKVTVVGILKAKGQSFGQSQDELVVIPITYGFSQFGGINDDLTIGIRASDLTTIGATMEEVLGHFRAIRKVPPGKENDFELSTNDSIVGSFTSFTQYLTIGGAGIGIMNIMLVSVTERTREIGIRKSIGAKRGDILRQFLYEAVFLCQIGGILGILFGVLGGNITAYFMDAPIVFPWGWAAGAVIGVTVIALVFGVYPAWKAARLDPIVALRYE
jgi:putative ABC transport system permease protein